MTPVRELTDEQLQSEWSAAQFFYGGTSADAPDSLESTMHAEACARIEECEAEMERRGNPVNAT